MNLEIHPEPTEAERAAIVAALEPARAEAGAERREGHLPDRGEGDALEPAAPTWRGAA